MTAKPRVVSPLEQRLALYGFAFLQVAPSNPINPSSWGVPDLQLLKPHRYGKHWEALFGNCRQFDPRKDGPVISPSLKSLFEIRCRSPNRPLIFCQTAFEVKPKPRTLVRLQLQKDPITRLLTRADGTDPIYWMPYWPRPEPTWIEALKGQSIHPLAALAQSQQKRNPHHQFWLREDGLLVEQLNLFHSYWGASRKEVVSLERSTYEVRFRQQFREREGITYVFSKKTRHLKWFARDCKRLLGKRVYCWWYPAMPDPRDPLVHLVLVKDKAIRFQYLPRPQSQIHCDGEPETLAFRDIRVQPKATCTWMGNREPSARAIYEKEGKALVFWETNFGWISQETRQMPSKDRSAAFRQRAQTMAILFRTRPTRF